MVSNLKEVPISITPKLKTTYTDFAEVTCSYTHAGSGCNSHHYFKIYQAKCRSNEEIHMIHILDNESEHFKEDPNHATTLFIQEMLHICSHIDRNLIVMENSECCDQKLVFVTKQLPPTKHQASQPSEPAKTKDVTETIKQDLKNELEKMRMSVECMQLKSQGLLNQISCAQTATCIIHNIHNECLQTHHQICSQTLNKNTNQEKSISKDDLIEASVILEEMMKFGVSILEFIEAEKQKLSQLCQIQDIIATVSNLQLEKQLQEPVLNKLLLKRPNSEQFSPLRDGESTSKVKRSNSYQKGDTISNNVANVVINSLRSEVTDPASKYQKIAWCSWQTNAISIYDINANKLLEPFQGYKLKKGKYTYLQHITGTEYLISVHHNTSSNEAGFEVLSTEYKKRKPVFTYDEVTGQNNVGAGDVSFNSLRGFAAVLPIQNVAEYHLLDCSDFKILKRAKWQSKHAGHITSIDLNPEGTRIVAMDYRGRVVVSDVNSCRRQICFETDQEEQLQYSRCRWSPQMDSPIIALKYKEKCLNLFDTQNKVLIWKHPLELDGDPYSVEWRNDANLIACAGYNTAKVFDIRSQKPVRIFQQLHTCWINCIKWSLDGSLIATASSDKTVKLIDFVSSMVLYEGKTADGRKLSANS